MRCAVHAFHRHQQKDWRWYEVVHATYCKCQGCWRTEKAGRIDRGAQPIRLGRCISIVKLTSKAYVSRPMRTILLFFGCFDVFSLVVARSLARRMHLSGTIGRKVQTTRALYCVVGSTHCTSHLLPSQVCHDRELWFYNARISMTQEQIQRRDQQRIKSPCDYWLNLKRTVRKRCRSGM